MSQTAIGQADGAGAVGVLDVRDAQFRPRLQDLLTHNVTDPTAGWALCRQLGSPALPLLQELHAAQGANLERRVILWVAQLAAAAPGDEEPLLARLDAAQARLEERVAVALVLALGPARSRRLTGFWPQLLGRGKAENARVLTIAANLAAARFPDTGPPPAFVEPDVGVLASAAFAGIPLADSWTAPMWRGAAAPRHAELFLRGALLGALRDPSAQPIADRTLRERARELAELPGEANARVRAAAWLLLGRAEAVAADNRGRPAWEQLSLLAAWPASAVRLQAWLPAVPPPLTEQPQRLAVEYVMSRPVATVIEERTQWGGVPAVRAHVAIALAFRLCGEPVTQPIGHDLPGVPEWFFVRWASGAAVRQHAALDDPLLDRLAALAEDGRLPRDAARAVLEATLWRWQSHPGLPLWQEQLALIRDLLLTGSQAGAGYRVGTTIDEVYQPNGMSRDNAVFALAVAAFEFFSRPRPPIPPECRLR